MTFYSWIHWAVGKGHEVSDIQGGLKHLAECVEHKDSN